LTDRFSGRFSLNDLDNLLMMIVVNDFTRRIGWLSLTVTSLSLAAITAIASSAIAASVEENRQTALSSGGSENTGSVPAIRLRRREANANDPSQRLLAQQSDCPGGLKVETVRGEGTATFEGRAIAQGDCLSPAIGTIVTEPGVRLRLRLDNYRGSLEVADVSQFEVATLGNDQIDLFVEYGQVRFSLGQLTGGRATLPPSNPVGLKTLAFFDDGEGGLAQEGGEESPFRVRTPTGVAGVRGTSFGIDVGPNGQTGITSLDGSVFAIAQNQEVTVGPGQYTSISPGMAPSAPEDLPAESKFRVLVTQQSGSRTVRIEGKIDRPDILLLDNELVETDPDGNFSLMVPRPASRNLKFVVRGPAVRERVYIVPLP
jgi:hypothetical protein